MIDFHPKQDQKPLDWASTFVQILPQIEASLQQAFRSLRPQRREESVQDGVVHCLLAHKRLVERGKSDSATPASLAHFAALQVRGGREAGCRLNGREPLSRYAQRRQGISVVPLSRFANGEAEWVDMLIDSRHSSVADQVATRLDFRAWFVTLPPRNQEIAKCLAWGSSTSEVAQQCAVSAGRISQLRRELEASWTEFQADA